MATLQDLKDQAQHKLQTGDATSALKIFRLVLEGVPLDFTTRLKIADCLLVLGETKLAGAVYTAVAVHGIKAGAPFLALVAIKMLSSTYPDVAKGLCYDLSVLYANDSPRIGRGVRPAPVDLAARVRDDLDLDYEMPDEDLRLTTAQMAAYTDNITRYPNRVPPMQFFGGLGADELYLLVKTLELRRYDRGELIARQGDPGETFFFVAQGTVRVVREDGQGGTRELGLLGEGSIVGEMAALSVEPRPASIHADDDVALLLCSRDALARLADELPQVAAKLERFATERVIRHLLTTNPFFKPFDDEQQQALLPRFKTYKVTAGTIIVRQDEPSRGVYLFLQGGAEAVRREGEESVWLADLAAGDSFGENACANERPTAAKVTATRDSTLLFLPKEYFGRLVAAIPGLRDQYTELGIERLVEVRRTAAAQATVERQRSTPQASFER